MGFLSRFEGKMEDGLEGAAGKMGNAPISPVQIAKKAEKAMRREKMVGAGKQYAPTLYTILVNPEDDQRLFGYYPTLAGETETYLSAKAVDEGLAMDGQPLVRFIVDDDLRHGKFDVIAEMVSAPIVAQLRDEEMQRYGLAPKRGGQQQAVQQAYQPAQQQPQAQPYAQPVQHQQQPQAYAPQQIPQQQQPQYEQQVPQQQVQAYEQQPQAANPHQKQQLPYVPEDEIDRSIDYGEYTFNSQDFEDYQQNGPASQPLPNQEALPHEARTSQPIDQAYKGSNVDFSGLDIPGDYNPNLSSQPFDNQPAAAGYAPQQGYAQQPNIAPVTSVFAAGAGAVDVIPNPVAVRAHLINTATNRSYDLATSRVILGRSSGSDIVLDDINASRSHAEICQDQQGVWSISDLGSTNGTLVNSQRIATHYLREGDHIAIGMTTFVFTMA